MTYQNYACFLNVKAPTPSLPPPILFSQLLNLKENGCEPCHKITSRNVITGEAGAEKGEFTLHYLGIFSHAIANFK